MGSLSIELYKQIQQDTAPTEVKIEGKSYSTRNISPVKDPVPAILVVNTLTGLVDYLKANVDKLDLDNLICHISSPRTVSIFSMLHGSFAQRSEFIRAELNTEEFAFGDFMSAERFNIKLQSSFVEPDNALTPTDKGLILKYVGNVRESTIKGVGDDGISQEITVKAGIASVADVVLPNPVTLCPFRTFHEVEQPASKFIFRAQDGPRFALFEADNGAWRSEAMQNVKAYLQQHIPTLHVIA